MDKQVEEFIQILHEEKESIEELKKVISARSSIGKSIEGVKQELNNIKAALKEMEDKLKEKNKNIDDLSCRIKELHLSAVLESIDEVEQVIKYNLPKDIYVKDIGNVDDQDVLKSMPLFKIGLNSQVGKVEIYKTQESEFKVKVKIGDEEGDYKNQEFIICEPLRVYKVISYIHTNLSYDE